MHGKLLNVWGGNQCSHCGGEFKKEVELVRHQREQCLSVECIYINVTGGEQNYKTVGKTIWICK